MVNHKHSHYDRHWGWQPIKATKLELLRFIRDKEVVTAHDLMSKFGYTHSSAKCRLSQLKKQRYIERHLMRGQWCLTQKGWDKVGYLRSQRGKAALEKHKRDIESQGSRLRVEELEGCISVVQGRLVQMSKEIKGMRDGCLKEQDSRSRLNYYSKLTVLSTELDKVMKQLAVRLKKG